MCADIGNKASRNECRHHGLYHRGTDVAHLARDDLRRNADVPRDVLPVLQVGVVDHGDLSCGDLEAETRPTSMRCNVISCNAIRKSPPVRPYPELCAAAAQLCDPRYTLAVRIACRADE